jgi:hypothetical protein
MPARVAVKSFDHDNEGGLMLVTFKTKAHADITMFGNIAVELLKLAGMTGNVPTAILADDVPGRLAALERALGAHRAALGDSAPASSEPAQVGDAHDEAAGPVSLRNRAMPVLELLRSAVADHTDVVVAAKR